MSTIQNSLFKSKAGFESGKPANNQQIAEAEAKLNLSFSKEYIDYLKLWGYVRFDGHVFTGINPFPGISVISVTNDAKINNPQIPDNYYAIEEVHIDGIIIWQDENGAIYESASGTQPQKIYNSFIEYIKSL